MPVRADIAQNINYMRCNTPKMLHKYFVKIRSGVKECGTPLPRPMHSIRWHSTYVLFSYRLFRPRPQTEPEIHEIIMQHSRYHGTAGIGKILAHSDDTSAFRTVFQMKYLEYARTLPFVQVCLITFLTFRGLSHSDPLALVVTILNAIVLRSDNLSFCFFD